MDCITQIIFAERKRAIPEFSLKDITIKPFEDCLNRREREKTNID